MSRPSGSPSAIPMLVLPARRVRLYDGLVVGWVVFWFLLAALIGLRLWQFADVGDSVADTGKAVSNAGAAIGSFGAVPLIGQVPEQVGGQIQRTGQSIAPRARPPPTTRVRPQSCSPSWSLLPPRCLLRPLWG